MAARGDSKYIYRGKDVSPDLEVKVNVVDDAGNVVDNYSNAAKNIEGPWKIDIKTIKENPQQLWGKTPEEIADAFRAQGYNVTIEQSKKGSGKAIIIRPDGGNINMVQIHPGGGRHESAYIKISTDNGKLKLISGNEQSYIGDPYGEKHTTVFWMED